MNYHRKIKFNYNDNAKKKYLLLVSLVRRINSSYNMIRKYFKVFKK